MNLEQLERAVTLAKELEYLRSVLKKINEEERITFHVKVLHIEHFSSSMYHLPIGVDSIVNIIEDKIKDYESALKDFGVEV